MNFDSRIISQFLSDEEIDLIEKEVEKHRSDRNTYVDRNKNSGHSAVTNGFFLHHLQYRRIAEILVPRLRANFAPDLGFTSTHILNAYEPYGIHTDVMSSDFDPQGPELAAWTFIIPLENYRSHTIVFEQKHDTIKTLDQWITATNPQPHEIDDEFHQHYLTHTDRLDLRWLTPECVFPWRKGTLFAADRRKFHTSDDFPRHGITCKRAIVIWSTVRRP